MQEIFAWPLPIRLGIILVLGAVSGSFVNWAIYSLAFHRRAISPWSKGPIKAATRSWFDRMPILGWFRLARESKLHGKGFWIRPMLLELFLGIGLAWLYHWEIEAQGLYRFQIDTLLGNSGAGTWSLVPLGMLHVQFFAHALLILLMTAASFIDIDEKLIPDEITVVGTLLGLVLMAVSPFALLPEVIGIPKTLQSPLFQQLEPPNGVILQKDAVLATHFVSPNSKILWPRNLKAAPEWRSLAIGLGCYWFWCFALMNRYWRGRRGIFFGLRLIAKRIVRDFRQGPMLIMLPLGTVGILATWWFGEIAWAGLLTALVGLLGGGLIVWGVRIAAYFGLRVEAMGFGDVILMMMIGTFLGWQACLILFFIAPFAALLYGILQLLFGRGSMIPYGPFLCMASVFVIVSWGKTWVTMKDYFAMGWFIPIVFGSCLFLMAGMLSVWRMIKENLIYRDAA